MDNKNLTGIHSVLSSSLMKLHFPHGVPPSSKIWLRLMDNNNKKNNGSKDSDSEAFECRRAAEDQREGTADAGPLRTVSRHGGAGTRRWRDVSRDVEGILTGFWWFFYEMLMGFWWIWIDFNGLGWSFMGAMGRMLTNDKNPVVRRERCSYFLLFPVEWGASWSYELSFPTTW